MQAQTSQIPQIPARLHSQLQGLGQAAIQVFRDNFSGDGRDPPTAEWLASAITKTMHLALASQLRALNESSPLQQRLPPELWALVWAELDARERFVVMQVSHGWRQLALRSPQLWTELCMSSNRSSSNCRQCNPPFDDDLRRSTLLGDCSWCLRNAHPRPSGSTMLVRHLIGLSGQLPFSLHLDILGSNRADATVVRAMSAVLAPHVHRLRTLDAHTDNPNIFIHIFLAPLPTPSNLARLSLIIDSRGERTTPSMQPLQFPRLEVLEITGAQFHPSSLNFTAPNLRTISFDAWAPNDIAHVLRACPTAQEVTMTLTEMLNAPTFDPQEQAAVDYFLLSANPTRINFVGVDPSSCASILAAFQSTLAEVDINFGGLELPVPLISFITNVHGATELELLITGDISLPYVGLALCGGPGRPRRVEFLYDYDKDEAAYAAFTSEIWAAIHDPSTLRKITVYSSMVVALFETAPNMDIKELVVEFGGFDAEASLVNWLNPEAMTTLNTQHFAKLENIVIRATDEGSWKINILAADILDSIRREIGFQPREPRDKPVMLITKGLMTESGYTTGPPDWIELAEDAIML